MPSCRVSAFGKIEKLGKNGDPMNEATKSDLMKAMVAQELGSPDVFRSTEIHKPVPGPDQVLIRVKATSVNPINLGRRAYLREPINQGERSELTIIKFAVLDKVTGPDMVGAFGVKTETRSTV